jgi:hypothetical protein
MPFTDSPFGWVHSVVGRGDSQVNRDPWSGSCRSKDAGELLEPLQRLLVSVKRSTHVHSLNRTG